MIRRARRASFHHGLLLGACAAALLVPCASLSAPVRGDEPARLQALRERLEQARSALTESEGTRDEAREELRASERAISAANRTLHELAVRRQAAAAELKDLGAQQDAIRRGIAAREQALGRLLAAMYQSGDPGNLRLLLSAQDPGQTARDLHYLGYVSRAQADLADSLRKELQRLGEVEAQGRESSARMQAIEQEQQSARNELLKQQAQRKRTLARASDRIRAQSREVKTLERDEARLARLVQEIARALSAPGVRNDGIPRSGEGDFAGLKGRLRLPVRGVVTHRFGSARSGGGPNWKGLFIRSAGGQEVLAVAPGRVVFADWMRGYGNLLILDHGGGYLTIYGNNESLLKEVGDRVAAAEPIALVGTSGGGQETGLYFEARYEGKAFDPLAWAKLR